MATAVKQGSIRAYARWRAERKLPGGTHGAVRKALAKKRIHFIGDGILDFAQCDQDWERNTDLVQGENAAIAARSRHQHAEVNDESDRQVYLSARTRKEQAEANRAELRYAQESGEVKPVAEAQQAFTAIGRIYAAARETIPRSVAPMLIGKTDIADIERIVRQALRDADERISKELEKRHPDVVVNL